MLGLRGSPAVGHSGPPRNATVGKDAILRSLFDAHCVYVWRLLRRMGVHEAATDDATQQVFMVVSSKLDQLRPGKEKAFLTGTAMRVASNYRRMHARRLDVSNTAAVEAALDPSADAEALLEQRRRRRLLDCALDTLPDELRAVLVLAELEDLTNPEVAELLHIPLGTVASRLRRARLQFRQTAEKLRSESEDDDA